MALHNKSKEIALFDCNGTELTPMQSVDLTQYDKLSGKGNNPSLAPTISGATISYDLSSWTTFPEAWSEGCGVWFVNGADMYVGQGTGCANLWNNIADVVAMMNSLDPNGLTWTLSGTTVSATSAALDPNVVAYQVATCNDIPSFVDCDGNPLIPVGGIWFIVYKGNANDFYANGGDPATVDLGLVSSVPLGIQDWFYGALCVNAQPAPVDNWEWTSSNTPITAINGGNTFSPLTQTTTNNPIPACVSGTQPTYEVASCANIDALQTQIDALAASEKYVVSGVIQNPNTATATLALTLNDGSQITIDVSSLEDTITAAQIIALFPNGANIPVTSTPTTIRFLGQDGQWHTLTIPATATTNTLASAVNTMTSTVNGVVASAPIVNSNTLTNPTANTLQSTVNGVASGSAAIIASNTLTQNAAGQLVDTVNGIASAPLTILASTTPLADGVGDTLAGAVGTSLLAARADHIHPITAIVTPPTFTDLLLSGNMTSAGAYASSGVVTTEETVTYKGQKPVTANTGTWSIANPPALAGYTLESFEGSPYGTAGMDAVAGAAGGGSRDFNWQYVSYYDNVRRNALAHNLSTKAVYKLN